MQTSFALDTIGVTDIVKNNASLSSYFAEQFAALAVPADVIERRAACLAPPRRLGDFLTER